MFSHLKKASFSHSVNNVLTKNNIRIGQPNPATIIYHKY